MSKAKTKKGAGKNAKAPKKDKAKQPVQPEQKVEIKTIPAAEEKYEAKKSADSVAGKKSNKRDFSLFKFNGVEYNEGETCSCNN